MKKTIPLLLLAAAMAACGPDAKKADTYDAQDALGNYAVGLESDTNLQSNYNDGSSDQSTVPADLFTGEDTFTGLALAYDAANHEFLAELELNGKTSTLHIPDSAVSAQVKGSSATVAFSPTLKDLASVTLGVQVDNASVDAVSNGCQTTTTTDLSVTFTQDGLTGAIHTKTAYQTVASFGLDPYRSCVDVLAAIELRIRTNTAESSDLPIFVANGALDINLMTSLSSVESTQGFSGAKTTMSSASKSLVIPNGEITRLQFQTKAPRLR